VLGVWPQGTFLTINTCNSYSTWYISVYEGCGSPSAPARCIFFIPPDGTEIPACGQTIPIEYGKTYAILLATDYIPIVNLEISFNDPTPPLADRPMDWPLIVNLISVFAAPIYDLLAGPDFVLLLEYFGPDNFDNTTTTFTTYYSFSPLASPSQISYAMATLADSLEDYIRLACHFSDLPCGHYKVSVRVPASRYGVVLWQFQDLHQSQGIPAQRVSIICVLLLFLGWLK